MLGWQVDRVVRIPEVNPVQREVGPADLGPEQRLAIAIGADQDRAAVHIDRQPPDLKILGANRGLCQLHRLEAVEIGFGFELPCAPFGGGMAIG